jgi:hypothetical protein
MGLPCSRISRRAGVLDDLRQWPAQDDERARRSRVLLFDEAVGKSRLRKAALRSQRWVSERLGTTASGRTNIPRRMRWTISEPTLRSDPAGSPGVFPTASDDSSSATGLRVAVGSAGGAWFRAARAGPTVFARVDRDALLPGAGAAVRGCGRRLRRWPGARRPGSRSRRAGRWRPGRPGRLWANGVMLRA